MLTVWKYPVEPGTFTLQLPEGAKILSVQTQLDTPQLLALVDWSRPTITRRFLAVGTGNPVVVQVSRLSYIGTFQLHGGSLIFHLFEIVEE